jgi:hypothetical protein
MSSSPEMRCNTARGSLERVYEVSRISQYIQECRRSDWKYVEYWTDVAGRRAPEQAKSSEWAAGRTRLRELMSHNERPRIPEVSLLMRRCELQLVGLRRMVVCSHWLLAQPLSLRDLTGPHGVASPQNSPQFRPPNLHEYAVNIARPSSVAC